MEKTNNSRLRALLQLIKAEDDTYGPVLKRELAAAIKENPSQVQTVIEEEFKEQTPLPVLHTLEEICWEDLSKQLARFSAKINPDLEEGLILLSKFIYPSISRKDVTVPLDELAKQMRPYLLNATTQAEIAAIFSRQFFRINQFHPLQANLDIKDISFARLLRKKKGSSLCLACLYILIGQRYGLDINLVDLAGRILIHLQDFAHQETLFIDPLDNGKILSQADCRIYIESRQIEWNDDFLRPLPSRHIIRRMIANMIYVLNKAHDERRLKFLREYLEIIKN